MKLNCDRNIDIECWPQSRVLNVNVPLFYLQRGIEKKKCLRIQLFATSCRE